MHSMCLLRQGNKQCILVRKMLNVNKNFVENFTGVL